MAIAVIVARQRSGTHALGTVFDRHPDLAYAEEVFNPAKTDKPPAYFWFLNECLKADPALLLPGNAEPRFARYVDLIEAHGTKRYTVLDIKYTSLHHFNGPWHRMTLKPPFFEFLARRQIPVIHITRRNLMRTLASTVIAESTKVYHTDTPTALDFSKYRADPVLVVKALNELALEDLLVEQYLAGYPKLLTIDYREIFEDGVLSDMAAERMAGFLGIAPFVARKPDFVKQAPARLEDVFENYEDVAKAVRQTRFAWMLTE